MKNNLICFLMVLCLAGCSESELVVTTETMFPLLKKDQVIRVDRNSYKSDLPKRFDIVVYEADSGKHLNLMRIIGLPGEKVHFRRNSLYVNGKEIDLPETVGYYVFMDGSESFAVGEDFYIPENQYFLIGDNMRKTFDSRFNGSIPMRRITGKVVDLNNLSGGS